jgi:hypothetical protein
VIFTSPRHVETVLDALSASADAPFEAVLLHGAHEGLARADEIFDDESLGALPTCPATEQDAAVILYTSGI